ncbi:TPA: hypothetical protein JG832_002472 [Enterobacter hormaechei subsp. xiangfangensis]|nr:hypothetical protein [Enterobacter hormaechei subsp. xiangfangensis]HAV1890607.1 hypothetical protein [Enterobacter hormaechei subsp. xiangfangensis]
MKFSKTLIASVVIASSVLTGCANTGAEYGADVYAADQLNAKQETKTVKILSVLPAKVAVDNKANKESAQMVGAILGAIAGAALGYQSHNDLGTAAGGAVGGTIGTVAGSVVKDKVMVDGVTLSYAEGDKVYSSTQLGKECLFTPGLAVVITTKANETRVQPNHTCPAK